MLGKYLWPFICHMLFSMTAPMFNLLAADVSSQVNIDFLWHPVYRVINENSPLNPGNFIQRENLINRAESNIWFNLYFGDELELAGNFEIKIDSTGSGNLIKNNFSGKDITEIKNAEIGFEQIYLQWNLLDNWFIGLGKIPVRNGFSRVYAPMNYNSRSSDFRNQEGQWNAWLIGIQGNLEYSFRYFPVFEFDEEPNNKNQTERFFSWVETSLKRQIFSFKLSYFFFDSLETNLIFFVQEKRAYNLSSIHYAGALGFSWPLLYRFTIRGEILAGNGFDDIENIEKSDARSAKLLPHYRYTSRDLDIMNIKVLGGFTTILPWDVEFSLEYFYNGAGYSDDDRQELIKASLDSGKFYDHEDANIASAHKGFLANGLNNWSIYDVGHHYLFMQIFRQNIADTLNFINTSILLLSDMSLYNSTDVDFIINDNFTLGAKFIFFLFKDEGAFSLSPDQLGTELSLKYSF